MSEDFVGRGYAAPTRYKVYVEQDGAHSEMTHRVHGSSVDYQWDGSGPDSTDLATALLWIATGVAPEWRASRLFKSEVVSGWPRHDGECWRLSEDQILSWLAGVEQDTALTETVGQTKARLDQVGVRESRLRRFAATFGVGRNSYRRESRAVCAGNTPPYIASLDDLNDCITLRLDSKCRGKIWPAANKCNE